MLPSKVPWTRPDPAEIPDAPGHWFSGLARRQRLAPRIFDRLCALIAAQFELSDGDPLVAQAVAELALGMTIEHAGLRYAVLAVDGVPASLAITDQTPETMFEDLTKP